MRVINDITENSTFVVFSIYNRVLPDTFQFFFCALNTKVFGAQTVFTDETSIQMKVSISSKTMPHKRH